MKVLVIGNGGREHALVWKLAQSPGISQLYCAPGNAGTAELGENVPIDSADILNLVAFAREQAIDFTIVGPELPLARGIVDALRYAGLSAFGPTQRAAQLESSKAFAKALMVKHGIPTAPFQTFSDPHAADVHLEQRDMPVVVKADGLAAGKGAIICKTRDDAHRAIDRVMRARVFGEAGAHVVIEDFLRGEEASFFALTDGSHVVPFPPCQDHKPVYNQDEGPNTGGMGAYCPAPVLDAALCERVMDEIMRPVVRALEAEGRPYQGVLYAGLMLVNRQPYVLEFNARFGDPETQAMLVQLETDLLPLLRATTDGTLDRIPLIWRRGAAVCVVMAAQGYPEVYKRGKPISGVEGASQLPGVVVFHAGTARHEGQLVTDGGRVLGVTALGTDIRQAIDRAYQAVSHITWEGVHYRTDIGHKALRE
ncbi:MAG: phosphoribosylamine--glycine ligase [Nitrospinae bacterium]|nr:phosphoribosylamine--glycine ligase [Nitrospinota bacterium]